MSQTTRQRLISYWEKLPQREKDQVRKALLSRQIKRKQENFLEFVKHTFTEFQESWHHRVLCNALERVANGECKRLIIQAPPRHSKTEFVQRRFPAWMLGKRPEIPLIGCSYSADLADRNNRDIQRIMEDPRYMEIFPKTRIPGRGNKGGANPDGAKRTNDFFEVMSFNGSYRSAGVGGGITGMGFEIGLIDDPFKDRKEAESETIRKGVWEWYTSTFRTRVNNRDAAIVLIMTRWHEDDLAGRLLELAKADPEADQWEVINLPAIMEEDMQPHFEDLRETGEALWPGKFDLEMLEGIRASQGSYDWESLYQQRPYPPGGLKIKVERFNRCTRDDVPASVRWAFFADLAVSTKTTADHTVHGQVGVDVNGEIYIKDLARYQKEWPDSKVLIKQRLMSEKPSLAGIEKAGQQQGFIDELNRDKEIQGIPLTIQHVPVDKDKLTRALPWIAKVEEGKVYLVDGVWVEDFKAECAKFTGKGDLHDDRVDFVSGGYQLVVDTYSNLIEKMIEFDMDLMQI